MSIIFEGVDGTGKTTAAQGWLIFNPDFKYIHNFEKTRKIVDIKSEATKEILLFDSDRKIIFDRSYIISEYIYSTILKRETPITISTLRDIAKQINERDHTVKLFYFTDIADLQPKEEDHSLPFIELNELYMCIINGMGIENLILEDIGVRV